MTTDAAASARGEALVVDGATTLCNHDLAYVVLDRTVSGPVAPTPGAVEHALGIFAVLLLALRLRSARRRLRSRGPA
jgi:hypothetical protein